MGERVAFSGGGMGLLACRRVCEVSRLFFMDRVFRLTFLLLDVLYFRVTLFAVPHVSIFTRLQMIKAVEFLYLCTLWAPFHPRNHGLHRF